MQKLLPPVYSLPVAFFPCISIECFTRATYLRDRCDAALAFATWLKGSPGYSEGPIAEFERLVSLKPQHYYLRGYFADVLAANSQHEKAIEVLNEALKIQEAAASLVWNSCCELQNINWL